MSRSLLGVLVISAFGAGQLACERVSAQSQPAPSPSAPAQAPPTAPGGRAAALSANDAVEIGVASYIFAYPLVTMRMTEKVSTNVDRAKEQQAPVGQFAQMRKFPTAAFKTVVAPNADTLYSTAWLDLSKEPWVLSHPAMGNRFYMFPILDAYTNVLRTPGARLNGGAPATYVITGPNWKGGTLPKGANEIKSTTNTVWILGRTYCDGTPVDLKAVHDLQDQYLLYPLSASGQHYTPPPGKVEPKINQKMSVRDQVDAMKVDEFFTMAAEAMAHDPPSKFDSTIVARMAKIGIVPGQTFDSKNLPPDVSSAFQEVPKTAQERIKARLAHGGAMVKNGWMILTQAGDYGMNYEQRAMVASIGLGANTPDQAVYPVASTDGSGQTLSGANKYVVHFPSNQTPPVKAFWSMTMYDQKMFFVPNPLNRYSLNVPRDQLKQNDDGSVDLYVQNQKPSGDTVANWLPAPKGDFVLMLRLYWPSDTPPSILDGSWQPPPVTRQTGGAPRMGRPAPPRPRPTPQ